MALRPKMLGLLATNRALLDVHSCATALWLPFGIAHRSRPPGRASDGRARPSRAIAVLGAWDQRPRRADLARIDVPALVILGEREPRTTIEGSS